MISQGQKMKNLQRLSPQQLLLMKMLQMPTATFEQAVKAELERNPMLEEEASTHQDSALESSDTNEETGEYNNENEESFDNQYDYDEDDYRYKEHQEYDPNEAAYQATISNEQSFAEQLTEQWHLKNLTPQELMIGDELIGYIDDSGYISRDLSLIANDMAFRKGIDVETSKVDAVLRMLQTIDPPGIAARNLQECLSLQLHRIDNPNADQSIAIKIIDKYFDLFSRKQYNNIMRQLNINEQQLSLAIDVIRHLNPKPGNSFDTGSDTSHYIVPDFIVTRSGNELSFSLNGYNTIELKVNQYYNDMLQQMQKSSKLTTDEKQTLRFLKNKNESAQWFINTIEQRKATLSRTMTAILQYQYNYFLSGDKTQLLPMKLKDIAEKTGYDISTISRVVTQKYVQTEFGTFLLKEVFSKSFTNDSGEEVATEAIKHYLQEAIANEDKQQPLTDEALQKILNGKGYPLARRTVAKYREMMGIPVGRLRKEISNKP